MSIPRLAIERPVTMFMISMVIILLGGISLTRLPVDLMPDTQMPTITVRVNYTGVGPLEMEELVTRPIEQAVSAVAGLERVSGGRISLAGHELSTLDEDGLALLRRKHVGIVFQSFRLVPTMTALENVAIPLELAGRADAFDLAAEALSSVGLGHRLEHYPDQLSGGEQQRVAIARAVVAKPSLILADEPTGNLDGDTGHQIIELLFERRRATGSTLMLITHDPELAARADRIIRLADGKVVVDGVGVAA